MIADDAVVSMPHWVRLQFDRVRERNVLLAPERVLFPCPTSVNIVERLKNNDGSMPFGVLIDGLVRDFNAPRDVIARDVDRMLQGLIDQRFLNVGPAMDKPGTLNPSTPNPGNDDPGTDDTANIDPGMNLTGFDAPAGRNRA